MNDNANMNPHNARARHDHMRFYNEAQDFARRVQTAVASDIGAMRPTPANTDPTGDPT